MGSVSEWLYAQLACPVDKERLTRDGDSLACSQGHVYAVVENVPVLLIDAVEPTHPYCAQTLDAVRSGHNLHNDFPFETTGTVDAYVQREIVKTNGNLYQHLSGQLPRYPIPEIRLPKGSGESLLDVGCNWGRWTISAARAGYRPVGLDPSLDAVLAGARVSRQLGIESAFVVGDARHLPFADGVFDKAFSYSVLQHFDKRVACKALEEMSRVTRMNGQILVQMPNIYGLRQAYNFVRQTLNREQNQFRVRYWRPAELEECFRRIVGPAHLLVDGFFSLNAQASDIDLLRPMHANVVRASEVLRRVSEVVPALRQVADSLYVDARNQRAFHIATG